MTDAVTAHPFLEKYVLKTETFHYFLLEENEEFRFEKPKMKTSSSYLSPPENFLSP